jgi:hypothetical protein
MHVHPQITRETLLPATPLAVPQKRGGGAAAQSAGETLVAHASVKGFYAQSLRNKKAADAAKDDPGSDSSNGTVSDEESGAKASVETSGLNAGGEGSTKDASIPRMYTAMGKMASVPVVAGEIFETTV